MKERLFGENIREAIRILRRHKISDEIKVTGLEIKIDGKKRTLSIEKAWELKRELDKLLHTESVPYPYPVYPNPVLPYVPYVPYTEPYITWGNGSDSAGSYPIDSGITLC